MRPGQAAPECPSWLRKAGSRAAASMRPGQAAPECIPPLAGFLWRRAGFNEAGAGCPGMRAVTVAAAAQSLVASMRPGQAAPECLFCDGGRWSFYAASMRPGQAAPECLTPEITFASSLSGFNEAGAGCPGMRVNLRKGVHVHGFASMRPGQAAPECRQSRRILAAIDTCFNEAGAGCPGMPPGSSAAERPS